MNFLCKCFNVGNANKKFLQKVSLLFSRLFFWMLFLYLIWEVYWYRTVGLACIKFHTHLMLYGYVTIILLTVFLKVRRELIRNIILLLLSITFSLLIVELLLISFAVNTTYIEKSSGGYLSFYKNHFSSKYHTYPHLSSHYINKPEYKFIRHTNSLGFSDKEWNVKKNTQKRILFFGDSFTEGDGAPQDSCYVSLLSDMLNKDSSTFELMNAGTCGSDPFFNYINYKERLLKFKPDVIIQSLSSGDVLTDMATKGGLGRFSDSHTITSKEAPWWEPIYAISCISRLYFSYLGYNELLIKGEATDADKKVFNTALIDLFKKYDSLATANNAKLYIVLRPNDCGEVASNLYYYDFAPLFNEFKGKENIEFINLIPAYKSYFKTTKETPKDYYWIEDGHHNSKGYWLMAKLTREAIFKSR